MNALSRPTQEIGATAIHRPTWRMRGFVPLDLFVIAQKPDVTFLGKPGHALEKTARLSQSVVNLSWLLFYHAVARVKDDIGTHHFAFLVLSDVFPSLFICFLLSCFFFLVFCLQPPSVEIFNSQLLSLIISSLSTHG